MNIEWSLSKSEIRFYIVVRGGIVKDGSNVRMRSVNSSFSVIRKGTAAEAIQIQSSLFGSSLNFARGRRGFRYNSLCYLQTRLGRFRSLKPSGTPMYNALVKDIIQEHGSIYIRYSSRSIRATK